MVDIKLPVNICGDIHGQFYDLKEMFKVAGEINQNQQETFIFLGDYIDRGSHGIEVLTLLFCLKIKYPEKVFLLRGNHETKRTTEVYGFYDEIHKKYYGQTNIWDYFTDVFIYFPLACLIERKYFCVHGGLSPQIRYIQ